MRRSNACDVFILLVSNNAMASSYVVDKEIAVVRERQGRGEDVHFYLLLLTPTTKVALDPVRDKNLRLRDGQPFSKFPLYERHQMMCAAADEIADLLRSGRVLVQAELVLRYGGYEIIPGGYTCREGLGRKAWTENPPSWHVQAWALRHAWKADRTTGPTFNASVNGKRYWARFGASDPGDRSSEAIEPQELSKYAPEARLDFTRLLSTAVLEREAGARLRWLEQSGFLLRKVETYDTRYRVPGDAYEWAMPTGGHGLRFAAPRVIVTLRRTDHFATPESFDLWDAVLDFFGAPEPG